MVVEIDELRRVCPVCEVAGEVGDIACPACGIPTDTLRGPNNNIIKDPSERPIPVEQSTPRRRYSASFPEPFQRFEKIWNSVRDQEESYDRREIIRHAPGTVEQRYGELLPNLVNDIIRETKLSRKSVFYDVGSGVGNVVLQVATQVGCRSIGYEILTERADASFAMLDMFKKLRDAPNPESIKFFTPHRKHGIEQADLDFLRGMGRVTLEAKDATCDEVNYADADVILLNNFTFPEELQLKFLTKFARECRPGTKIVCTKDFGPRYRPHSHYEGNLCNMFHWPWRVIETGPDAVSWTNRSLDWYLYVIDPEQQRKIVRMYAEQEEVGAEQRCFDKICDIFHVLRGPEGEGAELYDSRHPFRQGGYKTGLPLQLVLDVMGRYKFRLDKCVDKLFALQAGERRRRGHRARVRKKTSDEERDEETREQVQNEKSREEALAMKEKSRKEALAMKEKSREEALAMKEKSREEALLMKEKSREEAKKKKRQKQKAKEKQIELKIQRKKQKGYLQRASMLSESEEKEKSHITLSSRSESSSNLSSDMSASEADSGSFDSDADSDSDSDLEQGSDSESHYSEASAGDFPTNRAYAEQYVILASVFPDCDRKSITMALEFHKGDVKLCRASLMKLVHEKEKEKMRSRGLNMNLKEKASSVGLPKTNHTGISKASVSLPKLVSNPDAKEVAYARERRKRKEEKEKRRKAKLEMEKEKKRKEKEKEKERQRKKRRAESRAEGKPKQNKKRARAEKERITFSAQENAVKSPYQALVSMFPNVGKGMLMRVLTRCNNDLNAAMDFVLENRMV